MTTQTTNDMSESRDEERKTADNDVSDVDKYPIILDCMVEVLPRTWPGINKPGGAARVTRCHSSKPPSPDDRDGPVVLTHVDVHYVVETGHEYNVPIEYCRPAPQYDSKHNAAKELNPTPTDSGKNALPPNSSMAARRTRIHLRDRSALLGRCKRCGSLRNDCGSCDWIEEEEILKRTQIESQRRNEERITVTGNQEEKVSRRRRRRKIPEHKSSSPSEMRNTNKKYVYINESEGSSSQRSWSPSYSSDESYILYRRKCGLDPRQRLRRDTNHVSSSSNDDEDSDEYDVVLSKLNKLSSIRFNRVIMQAQRLALRSSERTGIQTIHQKRRKRRMYFEHRRKMLESQFMGGGSYSKARKQDYALRRTRLERDKDFEGGGATRKSAGKSVLEAIGESLNKHNSTLDEGNTHKEIPIPTFRENVEQENTITPDLHLNYEGGEVLGERSSVSIMLSTKSDESDSHCKEEGGSNKDEALTLQKRSDLGGNSNSTINCSGGNVMLQNEDIIGYVYDSDIGDREDIDPNSQTIIPPSQQNENNRTQSSNLGVQEACVADPKYRTDDNTDAVLNIDKAFIQPEGEIDPKYRTDDNTDDILNIDKTFIQPEGEAAAENLPCDVQDESAGLEYIELPLFFENKIKELEEKKIPEAEAATRELVRKIKEIRNSNSQLSEEKSNELESESWQSYHFILKDLIKDGMDQCRLVLKRLLDRRQFFAARKKSSNKKLKWSRIEHLDLLYDNFSDRVEPIVREARKIAVTFSSTPGTCNDSIYSSDAIASSSDESKNYTNRKDAFFDECITQKRSKIMREPNVHVNASTLRRISSQENRRKSHGTKLSKKRKSRKKNNTFSRTFQTAREQNGIEEPEYSVVPQSVSTERNSAKEFYPRRKKHSLEVTMALPKKSSVRKRNSFLATSSQSIDRDLEGSISESNDRKCRRSHCPAKSGQVRDQRYGRHPNSSKQYRVKKSSPSMVLKDDDDNCFFQMLEQSKVEVRDRGEEIHSTDEAKMPISQLCNRLTQSFATDHQSAIDLIRLLPSYFDNNNTSVLHLRESALIVFQTILKMIKKNGLQSLQEMIQTCNKQLLVNINLLICVVRLLDLSAHSHLTRSDGLTFELFTLDGLTQLIILQMLDVVYSQALPAQWGSPRPLSQEVFDRLLELRNSMGKVTHLLEAVSHSLLSQFECQKWHRSEENCENPWFVSAVDPKSLARYWDVGSKALTPLKDLVRMSQFDRTYPRSEINALWSILDFFGVANRDNVRSGTNSRWRLLSYLLLSQGGVLGIQKLRLDKDKQSRQKSIPSGNHIKRCAKEIRCFCTLLSSRNMDPLCEDSFVVKLIRKAITLDIDKYRNSITRLCSNSVWKVVKREDVKLVFELWNETDLSDTPSSSDSLLARRLFAELISYSPLQENEENESMFTLSSNSDILRSSQLLISSWIASFPKKKARWSRLLDSISTLSDGFAKNAQRMEREHSEKDETAKVSNLAKTSNNDFEKCFSPTMVDTRTSYPCCWVSYKEAAACILISVVHANTKIDPLIDTSCVFDRILCNRVSFTFILFLLQFIPISISN